MIKKKVLDEICSDEPCGTQECLLKKLVLSSGIDDFQIKQLKCIEIHKYLLSEKMKGDCGWSYATNDWIDKYAKIYRSIYDDEMSVKNLYQKTIETYKDID